MFQTGVLSNTLCKILPDNLALVNAFSPWIPHNLIKSQEDARTALKDVHKIDESWINAYLWSAVDCPVISRWIKFNKSYSSSKHFKTSVSVSFFGKTGHVPRVHLDEPQTIANFWPKSFGEIRKTNKQTSPDLSSTNQTNDYLNTNKIQEGFLRHPIFFLYSRTSTCERQCFDRQKKPLICTRIIFCLYLG